MRVLDLTRLLPGACATLLLADLGADVVKIEDPRGGDGMRSLPTAASGRPTSSAQPQQAQRHSRSAIAGGRGRARRPVRAGATSVVDSFRPSTARRLGVDARRCTRGIRALVCASISGFGQSGPYAERAAHDINYQALAGLLRPPQLPGPLVGDIGAATQAAHPHSRGAGAARRGPASAAVVDVSDPRGGDGVVDVSGDRRSRQRLLQPSTSTADGEWLALGALEAKFWAGFCERDRPADLDALQHAQGEERARVVRDVRDVMRSRTRDEVARAVRGRRCVPDDDLHARGSRRRSPRRRARRARSTPAPALGADTDRGAGGSRDRPAERARLLPRSGRSSSSTTFERA